ncbi:hypothetical protein [Chondromyces apiculatus]|uniref:hypothetical protein n=1 Tax=Chondromyces apiculatus TaxID=51 RepID=UPI0009DCC35B|nr:hypothetical protein [Chondromyces apiculatus]
MNGPGSASSTSAGPGSSSSGSGSSSSGGPYFGTCIDGVQNGFETDVDCGGMYCEPCQEGLHCVFHNDCRRGVCVNHVCNRHAYGNREGRP